MKFCRGFVPLDEVRWGKDDYFQGCEQENGDFCDESDGFEDRGVMRFWWDSEFFWCEI